jgi:hypothetical protein
MNSTSRLTPANRIYLRGERRPIDPRNAATAGCLL